MWNKRNTNWWLDESPSFQSEWSGGFATTPLVCVVPNFPEKAQIFTLKANVVIMFPILAILQTTFAVGEGAMKNSVIDLVKIWWQDGIAVEAYTR